MVYLHSILFISLWWYTYQANLHGILHSLHDPVPLVWDREIVANAHHRTGCPVIIGGSDTGQFTVGSNIAFAHGEGSFGLGEVIDGGCYSGVGWDIAEGDVELAEVSLGMVRILTGAWWLDDMVVVVT